MPLRLGNRFSRFKSADLNPSTFGTTVYETFFSTTENPASEGGKWSRTAADWTDMVIENGVCHGTNGALNTYDDSHTVASGPWSTDIELEATVYRSASLNSGIVHEVELLFRAVQTDTTIRLYEVLFNAAGGVEIYRWDNGAMSEGTRFSGILGSGNKVGTLDDGDVIRARMVGSNITAWINDVQIATATDSTYSTGNPAIGSFTRPGGNSAHLAFTRLKITPL